MFSKEYSSNAAVRHSHTAHKQIQYYWTSSTQHFLIQFQTRAFQVTAACYCVGHYRECHTQKRYALPKAVRLVRIQNPLQQEPASCKQSTSSNNTAVFNRRTRSHSHVRLHNIAVLFAQMFCFRFSFVIVLVFVRSARCNLYFYIVFVSQIVIILVFVLIERSVIILVFVFVFVTKIALYCLVLSCVIS